MGVPAFFRWLSRKYTSIVVHCVEERGKEVDGVVAPIDTSQKNPNDVEFDNLYLDMNGIIHPCCHPENKPAPQNEDEMMVDIFAYIDRIFNICRPRKLLYMAIDGVAPRAKMNQQRSRRFRASKESVETSNEKSRIREEMLSKGYYLPPEKPKESKFDSNCITPGTPFMFRLAECLRFYIHDRLNNDPGWANIKVILSDANVPGEGEHKIMDYIRRQRAQPDHDPNTHHCLCGADADLIMLGLATHEPNFTIIREEFKPNQPKPCDMCGQMGHEMQECTGLSKEECDKPLEKLMGSEQEFIFIRLPVLREHLQQQLRMDGLPFEYNFERALDDWVFMCFFVGNDFLPHLPSLEIREGAIDRLVNIYKQCVYKTGGYLTDSGVVNLSRVQYVLSELGKVEDEIFKTRRVKDLEFRRRERNKKLKNDDKPRWMLAGQYSPAPVNSGSNPIHNPRQTAADMRRHMHSPQQNRSFSNFANASSNMMHNSDAKRKYDNNDEDEDEPEDDVKLWEDGWKDRYYKSKFNVDNNDIKFRHQVANHYVRGLCWVLRYYYQGCASWKWYFPYHYAPFASDFINIGDLSNEFEKHTQPFKPLEQLMGVFPAASRQFLPPTWQHLMTDDDSPIIDFYPTDFKIDLNGKKYAWQGVALLPFVDETRLKAALATVYDDLSEEEKFRNIRGNDRLFVSSKHPLQSFLDSLYEGSQLEQKVQLNTKLSHGMGGAVWCDEIAVLPGHTVFSPLPQLKDLNDNQAISVYFNDPTYSEDFLFPAKILPNAIFPPPTVKPDSYRDFGNNRYRPQLGFQRDSGYRDNKDVDAMVRMIRHNTSSYNQQTPSYNDGRGRNPGVMIPPTVETYGSARGGYMGRSGGNWHGGAGGSGNFGKGNYYGGGNRGGGSNYGGNRGGWGSNRGGYNNPNDPYKRNRQGGNQWEGGNNWNSGGYRSRGGGGGGGGNQYHRGYY